MNITPYFNNLHYIKATAEQIQKDFNLFGLSIKFSGNPDNAYNELLYQISPFISDMLDRNYSGLLSLLYRIDVKESKVAELANSANFGSLSEAIADLILRRELQKIVIRKHFKPDQESIF